jgi:hypothetical protein
MSDYERQRIDLELKQFANRHFEKPLDCKNLEQIRFYIRELCFIIEDYEHKVNYVPKWVYTLLAQYNARQNSFLYADFTKTYC